MTTTAAARRFPADWPEDCPPNAAAPTTGPYFRVVTSTPPAAADFRTHRELGKLPKAPECLRAGLSTFRTHEDAERMALLVPVLGSFVAAANLDGSYGVSTLTPGRLPTHTTLWPHEGTDRATPFDAVTPIRRPS